MENYSIISFALEDFDGPWLSRQFIATSLARHANVLYLTPERQFDAVVADFKAWNNTQPFFPRKLDIGENLVHLEQGGVFPSFYKTHATLNSWTRRLRMDHINRTVRSLGWPATKVIYVWNPVFHEAFGCLNETVSIFHCVDYFPHYFPEGSEARKTTIRNLEACLRKADIVFTTCKILEDKLAEHVDRKYTRLLHGVNTAAFNDPEAQNTPVELQDIPHPRLAHIGRINNKIDTGLLASLAEKNPQWSVILMGPIVSDLSDETRAGLARLELLPNAYILPGRPPEELPPFFHSIDVGLMAYHMAYWVPYGLPLKFFEFLGAGKPMVCSPLDSMAEFPEFVSIANSLDSWIAAIENALTTDSPAKRSRREQITDVSSWDHRAEEIIEHIHSHGKQATPSKSNE